MAILKKYNNLGSRQLIVLGILAFAALSVAVLAYNIFFTSANYQATGRVYPNADVQTDFNSGAGCIGAGCSTSHAAVLDEVSYNFSDYVFDDDGGDGEVEEFQMTEAAGATKAVQEVEVNFRAYSFGGGCNGGCDQIQVGIFIDGAYRGTQTVTLNGTDTLYNVIFSGAWTGDDDLRVQLTRIRQQAADNIRITRVFADIEYTQPNLPPAVDSVTATPAPDPVTDIIDVTQGDTITFEISWSDNEGNSARAIICRTNDVVGGGNPGCPGDAWVGPSPLDSSGTISLNYTANSNDAITSPNEYYVFVCDSPGGECSGNPPLDPPPAPSLPNDTGSRQASGLFTVERITAELYDWAWSENIGWISFNHLNCDGAPLPDGGDGATDTQNHVNCPVSEPTTDYNVNLDTATGQLSGHAWSENAGWISFNRGETGTPPEAPFNGAESFIARLEGSNLRGWARALAPCETPPADGVPCDAGDGNAGGWDGWVKLGD